MLKINFKRKKKRKKDAEFASEVVEILEEKIDDMKIKLPPSMLEQENENVRFRKDIREDLVYKISDFISINKKNLINEIT